ncbi:DUF6912 family protein [Streptomyces polyrhachis]|uniref:DUF6912 family protein n=1 Tax=Streptomyces polyrhachis TaxID=1282885 RepID=A0ABW2GHP6_9ACTN
MRVYVPLTLPALAGAHKAGELGPGPLTGYAVTPELREWYASDDIEELEYAALGRAAAASLRLLAGDPDAPRRRVVVAVELPDGAVVPHAGGASGAGADADAESADFVGAVRIERAVALRLAAALHVDADEARAEVAAAVGGAGDVEGVELLWFGVQELPNLI